MFAYCLNNPIGSSDSTGTFAQSKTDLTLNRTENGGTGIVMAALAAAVICYTAGYCASKTSDDIDWDSGNHRHILSGSWKRHIAGWNLFGIDPKDPKDDDENWAKLIPILKEVVDHADYYGKTLLKNGNYYIKYFSFFPTVGVKVMVKIWFSADGVVQKISDAVPYIISGS